MNSINHPFHTHGRIEMKQLTGIELQQVSGGDPQAERELLEFLQRFYDEQERQRRFWPVPDPMYGG
jgi:hypothetical protein